MIGYTKEGLIDNYKACAPWHKVKLVGVELARIWKHQLLHYYWRRDAATVSFDGGPSVSPETLCRTIATDVHFTFILEWTKKRSI